ncbi:hypothetical protein HYDPIDRAFT_118890 [Hydnomerulius pinastri MD-312]|uniref:Fe2OG dioxygenase domain-containing protein n=1 Tax=Hydnomerulius pinastri MD-312 TaxID=994086 RepID=A0A0C9W8N3_9AGAM|nr:hypothetical protein HYDPIDRAFT_118890 [Hydnomerulius pinastri MD-312]
MSLADSAVAVNGAFTSIPIIDLSKRTTPEGRIALAQEIQEACMKVGFFYIKNHGIPPKCLNKVLAAMEEYFALDSETKLKLHHNNYSGFKGYSPPLDANIDPTNNTKGDLHEGFRVGWEEIKAKDNDEKRANDGAMAGANVWPSECPRFREACLEYYHEAAGIGKVLYPLFALALNLPETFFDDKTKNSAAIMRALHYPLQDGQFDVDDDTPGIGAHTEFTCFTILWQQPGITALQVRNSEKRWIDAVSIDGTLVINIGDQLALWTNDVFKSTVHRAMNKSGQERYSIPMFFGTDYHVNIEPIPSCVSEDRPFKYSPITAGEYVNQRLKNMYHGTQ